MLHEMKNNPDACAASVTGSVDEILNRAIPHDGNSGELFLVGTGPGDADLLTVKAWKLITQAKVVVYDRLVSEEILALIPPEATRYYVGKRPGSHSVPQHQINQLMVQLAYQHPQVLRLKGGDPAVFGRLAEERDALIEAGVRWSVVPGITAASGCAASVGIALTDRACAHSVRFVTATHHSSHLDHDWHALAAPDQTVVFYMGVESAAMIAAQLQAQGRPADWPVLVVEKGTTPAQRNYRCTLSNLTQVLREQQVSSPALLIVGEVAMQAVLDKHLQAQSQLNALVTQAVTQTLAG